ncbi:c-type cytochrome [Methylocystis sp. SC2]|uniref:c-type cytochrome n=1 Tax=Methylocystis sp. (strain SC2) TaxID=187303 RepID=UPI00027AEAE8|nr:c-type cytochrome [Methylocystis sp. SC2]CCJ08019.1 Class I diheme cytochrome c [Methylocystis sp. SC2]
MSAKDSPLRPAAPIALLAFCLIGPAADAGEIERGRYLVDALAACDNCHTPRGAAGYDFSNRFSGGAQTFSDKSYVVRGSNISPDKDTRVGAWTDAELCAAIIDGVGRKGRLAPVMPSDSYKPLTSSDLDAIIAFLRSATPIRAPLQAPQQRSGEWAPHPMPGAAAPFDEASLADKNTRGLYVASLARCLSCHSEEIDGAPDYQDRLGAGGKTFRNAAGVVVASNITSHPAKGVGAWSDDELKRAITQGVARDGAPLRPPMSTLSKAHFSKMSPDDLDALVAWIRTIPPKE